MSIRDKRKKNQQKWPDDYRLEYKLPNWSEDAMITYKYCTALDDAQAMVIFNEMFAHQNVIDYITVVIEKYDKYADKWNNIDIVNTPVDKPLI